jgi:streptomycin 6-kinase
MLERILTTYLVQIPNGLQETVLRVHGTAGQRWLNTLPALIEEWRERWALELSDPFENLSYNLVIPGRNRDGAEIVLKVGVPCPELSTEAAALNLFQGVGAVRLLEQDTTAGVLLLERITPGNPLHELQEEREATRTAAMLMRQLWRAPLAEHSFPSLAIWFNAFERLRHRFGGGSGPFPPGLIARAERAFAELDASSDDSRILHGDLHHDNILFSAERGWVAIDPKGIVGDRGYEVGSFMLNQLPAGASASSCTAILSQRLSIFADELQISRQRLALWSFCHAVLSALWDMEESADCRDTIRLAQLLEQLS